MDERVLKATFENKGLNSDEEAKVYWNSRLGVYEVLLFFSGVLQKEPVFRTMHLEKAVSTAEDMLSTPKGLLL